MDGKTRKRSYMQAGLITAAAILLLMFALTVVAQQATGTILGVVKDASGAVIPGVSVTIMNEETNLTRTTLTGENGAFRAPALPVGRYNVKVELTGFQTQVERGLTLEVGQELVVNPVVQVGAGPQSEVTVSSEAPLVNTTTSNLGTVVNERSVSDLPLNGRNYVDLTLLQPGVNQQSQTTTGGEATVMGTWFSANGAPVRSNYYTLDGAQLNSGTSASGASESGATLGIDGIREYKVVSSAFSAEYGMLMGSQTVMVSKGGTNQWHGDVFEYLRNSAMDARNFFDYSTNLGIRRLPEFQRNSFGGSGGGPIKKDKTFFYGVYEGLRQNLGVSVLDAVLPAACHQFVNPGTSNTTLANAAACSPTLTGSTVIPQVVQPLIDLYPTPNLPNNQFSFPTKATVTENYGQFRMDQNFSAADTLFGRYSIDKSDVNSAVSGIRAPGSGVAFPGVRFLGTSLNQSSTLSESHVFSPAFLNTARLSFSRTNLSTFTTSDINLAAPQYAEVPGLPLGNLVVNGISGYVFNMPQITRLTVYTLSDDLFYTRNRHALKFGGLFNQYQYSPEVSNLLNGQATFNDIPSFMQGIYGGFGAATSAAGTYNPFRFWSYKTMGFYVQDDLKATSRLTLNLGFRYEFQTVPRERYGIESRFLNFYDPTQTWTYGPVVRNPSLKNFSLRVGFAWDIRGDGKTAIRSGFGIYHDLANFGNTLGIESTGMVPYAQQKLVGSNPQNQILTLPFTFPASAASSTCSFDTPAFNCTNAVRGPRYEIQQPHSIQYNLTVEQQMPMGMGMAVSYVGYRGLHLWQNREGNPIAPTDIINGQPAWMPYLCAGVAAAIPCPAGVAQAFNPNYHRINPAYASYNNQNTLGDSWYNSLELALKKRLSHGLEFQSAYTLSHSIDDIQSLSGIDCADGGASAQTLNPLLARMDRGPSCFDIRHNFHLNVLYHFPDLHSDNFAAKFLRGWWMGNILNAHTGFPFTPVIGVGRSNNGSFGGQQTTSTNVDRPNIGADSVSSTFKCSGTASAFPGAPACSNGTVTYQFIPFDKDKVITGDPNMWFNPLMFRLGTVGFLGNSSRGLLRSPGLNTWDLSLNKDTGLPFLGEGGKLQFRAEVFNLLNHANFAIPANNGRVFNGTLTDPSGASGAPIANVGRITRTATSSRQIQLALKIIF
jgi:hypothetical protein